ncbi:hypothetical protein GDO78_018422 [Eleutherodactylus coqui]|uniref:Uncharacterized protein n=1 Tax=Eleutherodactylus coqui TaxID=57060 RepID=A0A8J6EBS5_ELECQ|nr:hypothetical protein GDO78_018422 [Eleutherodactylus coqui]
MQGTIQTESSRSMIRVTRIPIPICIKNCFHCLVHTNHSSQGLVIPELRFSSSDNVANFFIAIVTLPEGPVFYGIYVQQVFTNHFTNTTFLG